MRQTYIPSQSTRQLYRSALNNDLGIYRVQSGAGIGGFFKKMFKYIMPIGKSMLSKGFEMAKPELQKLATKGINYAGQAAIKGIQSRVDRSQKTVNKRLAVKRKIDTLT